MRIGGDAEAAVGHEIQRDDADPDVGNGDEQSNRAEVDGDADGELGHDEALSLHHEAALLHELAELAIGGASCFDDVSGCGIREIHNWSLTPGAAASEPCNPS